MDVNVRQELENLIRYKPGEDVAINWFVDRRKERFLKRLEQLNGE